MGGGSSENLNQGDFLWMQTCYYREIRRTGDDD